MEFCLQLGSRPLSILYQMHCHCQCLVLLCGFSDVSCHHRKCSYIHDLNHRCISSGCCFVEGWGSCDRQSAHSFLVPGVYSIRYMYELAHCCILPAARVGTPWSWPKILLSGRWSVMRVNSLPYKYWWHFLTAKIITNASLSIWAYLDSICPCQGPWSECNWLFLPIHYVCVSDMLQAHMVTHHSTAWLVSWHHSEWALVLCSPTSLPFWRLSSGVYPIFTCYLSSARYTRDIAHRQGMGGIWHCMSSAPGMTSILSCCLALQQIKCPPLSLLLAECLPCW